MFLDFEGKKGESVNKRLGSLLVVFVFAGVSLCFAPQAAAAALPVIDINQADQQIELQSGQPVGQTFVSPVDSFGSLEVRFNNYFLQDELYVVFRIKEAGAEDWSYQNRYGAKDFYNGWFYPFGFPVITNAEGKEYYFEIELEPGQLEANEPSELYLYQNAQGEQNFRLLSNMSYEAFLNQLGRDFITKLKTQPVFFVLYSLFITSVSIFWLNPSQEQDLS